MADISSLSAGDKAGLGVGVGVGGIIALCCLYTCIYRAFEYYMDMMARQRAILEEKQRVANEKLERKLQTKKSKANPIADRFKEVQAMKTETSEVNKGGKSKGTRSKSPASSTNYTANRSTETRALKNYSHNAYENTSTSIDMGEYEDDGSTGPPDEDEDEEMGRSNSVAVPVSPTRLKGNTTNTQTKSSAASSSSSSSSMGAMNSVSDNNFSHENVNRERLRGAATSPSRLRATAQSPPLRQQQSNLQSSSLPSKAQRMNLPSSTSPSSQANPPRAPRVPLGSRSQSKLGDTGGRGVPSRLG